MTTAGSAPKGEAKLRNEAVERLRDFELVLEANSLSDGDLWPLKTDAWKAVTDWVLTREVALKYARELCDKRVADERRATVERIRERVESLSGVFVLHRVLAILDEEAAR